MLEGLNARLHIAKANVFAKFDKEASIDEFSIAHDLTSTLAKHSFQSNNSRIPQLIAAEPALLKVYKEAYDFEMYLEDARNCPCCNAPGNIIGCMRHQL